MSEPFPEKKKKIFQPKFSPIMLNVKYEEKKSLSHMPKAKALIPAAQQAHNVERTSINRQHIESTLNRRCFKALNQRCFNIMFPLK